MTNRGARRTAHVLAAVVAATVAGPPGSATPSVEAALVAYESAHERLALAQHGGAGDEWLAASERAYARSLGRLLGAYEATLDG